MNFDDLLKSLQLDYLSSIPEKIVHIRKQIEAQADAEVRDSFHKLKGTGRTYGIPEISELAEVVESLCIKWPRESSQAAQTALSILADIHSARTHALAFELSRDPRFGQIQQQLLRRSS